MNKYRGIVLNCVYLGKEEERKKNSEIGGRENKNRKIFKAIPDKQRFVKRSVQMSCFELISIIF